MAASANGSHSRTLPVPVWLWDWSEITLGISAWGLICWAIGSLFVG